MSTRFFTNEGDNTLLKKFAGVFTHNPDIERYERRPLFPSTLAHRTLKRHECRAPIPTATFAERSAIEGLVEKCLAARAENCVAWETEINARVFRLYGLTPEEIQLVEESSKK